MVTSSESGEGRRKRHGGGLSSTQDTSRVM